MLTFGPDNSRSNRTQRKAPLLKPLRIEDLDGRLRASGTIEGQHALQLRRLIYASETVSRESAEILFKLDAACARKAPAFTALYVEALMDYFVWQTDPKGYVTPKRARFLLDNVAADGHIARTTELELVLNIVHWARQCPENVVILVLDAVRESVLLPKKSLLGANRPRRNIGAGDVAILRKALHAPAGDGSLLVTRREAELLFALNDETEAEGNDPEWKEFFVRSIANHLLNPMDTPVAPEREEAARRERWLGERGTIGNLLTSVAGALSRGNIPVFSVLEELDPFGAVAARKEAEAEARQTKKRLAREQIDAEEAAWLAGRLMRSGTIGENEKALLAYLKMESPALAPALLPLLECAGV